MSKTNQSRKAPLVTIGLPVYNNSRHLPKSIGSLLSQTFRDFVLVISDNASTDGTSEICQQFARDDARVEYHRNPVNIGLTANFNRVFELSNTKYFKWATGDDFSAPDVLADAVAVLEADPSIALFYPKTVIVNNDSVETGRFEDELHLMQDDPVERFFAVIGGYKLVNHHLGVLRSDAIRRTQLFGKYVGADIGFIAEMSLYGKFYQGPKHQFFRRFHSDSSSWNRGDQEQEARRFHAANVRRVPFGNWLFHRQFMRAVLRSPLPPAVKARVLLRLVRQMYWHRSSLFGDLSRDVPPLLGLGNRGK